VAGGLEAGAPPPSRVVGVSTLYLVRHAHAGERGGWHGPDAERPLSERGWGQAQGLVTALREAAFGSVWSSPARRCVQTVEPLAEARRLEVRTDPRLFEGHDAADTMRFLEAQTDSVSVVASTHGDLIPQLLDLAADAGGRVPADARWAKGSVWVLQRSGGRWLSASYLPPAG
jgi:broad specificity phosphatase PhoE